MPNLTLNFAEVMVGAILLAHGITTAKTGFASSPAGSLTGAGSSSTPTKVSGFPAAVDPLPGATGSRLDQGIDFTGSRFVAPFDGKVVVANQSDPGWAGGGYIAIQSTQNPSVVYYIAEGIAPIVKLGQDVTAGQSIARAVSNPYNGIVGNGEAGLANPSSPGQPLAQVTADPSAMVLRFYHWLLQLGGPKATSTSHAGLA